MPSETVAGWTVSAAECAAGRSTSPAPWAPWEPATSGSAVPTSALFSPFALRPGRACASRAAAPATAAAATLVPLTVVNRGEPSAFVPGAEVTTPTPGPTSSGLIPPSKASPCDENAATRA